MTIIRCSLFVVMLSTCLAATALEVGDAAPVCVLKPMDSDVLTDWQKELAGKVVYVDFWASWCGPCLQSMPFMEQLAAEHKAKGFEVVAINMDDEREAAEQFLVQHPVKLRNVRDMQGTCALEYGVQVMPSSFLIDREGKVRHLLQGFNADETADIRTKVQTLLKNQ